MPFITTFYSFKGGVGRTVLAANCAALLARSGKTLLWDFDLEAPGLHRIRELASAKPNLGGFFEWLLTWQKKDYAQPGKKELQALSQCLLPVDGSEQLFTLPAHGADAKFTDLYLDIDWHHFLASEPQLGLDLINGLLTHLADEEGFRYFVLDSRTGITDIGGLLTVFVPHCTVLVGNYGVQNTAGLAAVWEAFIAAKQSPDSSRRPELGELQLELVASPIPDDDTQEQSRLQAIWEKNFQLAAGSLIQIPETEILRRGESILALSQPDHPTVKAYQQLTYRLQQHEAELYRAQDSNQRATLSADLILSGKARGTVSRAEQGKSFEQQTADLLRLLGYRVEPEQTLDGNRVDLIATLKQGLEENVYLVECKDHQKAVAKEVVEKLAVWLTTPKARDLNARGMVIARAFSPQAIEFAKAVNIRTYTPVDLESALIDFAPYLQRLIGDFAQSPLARSYVDQLVIPDGSKEATDLLAYALAWSEGQRSRLSVLLGDYGTGKTAFTRRFAYELATRAQGRPQAILPLLVNLRDFPNKTSLADLLHEHWAQQTGERRDPAIFLHLLARGRLLVIFDSFDEMGISQSHRNIVEQFRMLAQPAASSGDSPLANRVLITCREQFFREHNEALRTTAGLSDQLAALEQAAREFSGDIAVLPRFTHEQIQSYLDKRLGEAQGQAAWQSIEAIYNLKSLADRPQLLDMIIDSLPELQAKGETITAGALYQTYTNRWLEDEKIRPADRQTNAEELRNILALLAVNLWQRDGQRIHHAELAALILQNPALRGRHDPSVIDIELRTAAFLSRTADGYYGFSHRSFLEYFYARALFAPLINGSTPQSKAQALSVLLLGPRLSQELCHFFADLLEQQNIVQLATAQQSVAALLADASQPPAARRNAYLLAYWVAEKTHLRTASRENDSIAHFQRNLRPWLPQAPARLQLAECNFKDLALPGALLANAELSHSNWENSDLSCADLSQSNATASDFRKTELNAANFSQTRLIATDCRDSDATGIFLTNAEASLSRWINADLRGADIGGCDWHNADLRAARLGYSHGEAILDDAQLDGCTAPGTASLTLPQLSQTTSTILRPWLPKGHSSGIRSVAISPDGGRILTGSGDKTARLWDIASGRLLREFTGHWGEVWSVAFAPDGGHILTGSGDKAARLWNTASGRLLREFTGHQGVVWHVAFAPNGSRILTGSGDKTARLWDVASGRLLREFTGHWGEVWSVAFAPDGDTILTSNDNARLWDTASGQLLHEFASHTGGVNSVAFSPCGDTILTGCGDDTARLWDTASGQLLREFAGHRGVVRSVAFSPDGSAILTGSGDETARLWDATSGQLLYEFSGHRSAVWSVAFTPDGNSLLTGSDDKNARLWDTASGQLLHEFAGHREGTRSVAYAPDNVTIFTGSHDTGRLWDTVSGQFLCELPGNDSIRSVAFAPDGGTILTCSYNHKARLWDTASGRLLHEFAGQDASSGQLLHMLAEQQDWIMSVAFAPDGATLLTGSYGKTASLWDASSCQLLREFTGHHGAVWSVAFSPDGHIILAGSDNSVRLWDATSGQMLREIAVPGGSITSVAFAPDSDTIFVRAGNSVCLWDAASGQILREIAVPGGVTSIAFAPDGTTLLTGSADYTVRLWDTASDQLLREFAGHGKSVTSVTFAPDGKTILTASDDNTARRWDIATGTCLSWCWASEGRWFWLDDPEAPLLPLKPRLRGRGPLPLVFRDLSEPTLPAPWLPRDWYADDLPGLWYPDGGGPAAE
jgi:WD40 repeat protein